MSSSGLIYAVIVGAWAAYLVPMWLRRQDELNEARPTERFSTAIRLLSGRAGMERRYAKDLRARSTEEDEPVAGPGPAPDGVTDSVDVRAFAMPPAPSRQEVEAALARQEAARAEAAREEAARHEAARQEAVRKEAARQEAARKEAEVARQEAERDDAARLEAARQEAVRQEAVRQDKARPARAVRRGEVRAEVRGSDGGSGRENRESTERGKRKAREGAPARPRATAEATARARRTKVLARRRRTTVVLFLAFTAGAVVAAVGGLAFLWAPALPAVLLSGYIAYLRRQERHRFAYVMDRRSAELAAQRLRERQPRRPQSESAAASDRSDRADRSEGEPVEPATDPELSALAADRRALVEQTDHAEWVDQQRERHRSPGQGGSWDPVPVPLPTYVTAPVAPRATGGVDLGAPDAWSSARSSAAEPTGRRTDPGASPTAAGSVDAGGDGAADGAGFEDGDERCDARRAASARRSRERGRTPLFDQYEEKERPRAANE
ncbi:gephyrin-like molybdotransferase receptor GlpR [Streptomyces sp. NPDC005955]|uniref:divisome protein SepX/GlpR n=1 Tax=Streptomyces sp. NPDC005955 TaxID=3364738 RepID=UPI0036A27A6D